MSFDLFLLAIVFSVVLKFTVSDYPFGFVADSLSAIIKVQRKIFLKAKQNGRLWF